jgi:hypothetical protein
MLNTRRRYVSAILIIGSLAAAAYGNGINPPRPKGAKTVEATCRNRNTGMRTTVERARITIAKPEGSLEVKLGKSRRSFQLSQFETIKIETGEPNSDGFGKASFNLYKITETQDGYVRLISKGKPALLTGFSTSKEPLSLPLANCSEVTFRPSSQTSEGARGGGVPKQ